MDLDTNWPSPVDIHDENDTRITLNETFKRRESFISSSVSVSSDDLNRTNRNRLRIKFDKYFNSMNDELIQSINEIDSDRSTKILKFENLKKVNNEIILMILYCLQPTVRTKISVFNFNQNEKLSETILRSICKCKIFIYLLLNR